MIFRHMCIETHRIMIWILQIKICLLCNHVACAFRYVQTTIHSQVTTIWSINLWTENESVQSGTQTRNENLILKIDLIFVNKLFNNQIHKHRHLNSTHHES